MVVMGPRFFEKVLSDKHEAYAEDGEEDSDHCLGVGCEAGSEIAYTDDIFVLD